MEAPTLPKIRLKKSVKSLHLEKHLIRLIIDEVKKFPDYLDLKFDNQAVEIVLKCLLDALPNTPSKSRPIQIGKVALEILKEIFSLVNPEDVKIVERQVQYFLQNKIVRRKTRLSSIINSVISLVKKR
jgi:hypothetical protein